MKSSIKGEITSPVKFIKMCVAPKVFGKGLTIANTLNSRVHKACVAKVT